MMKLTMAQAKMRLLRNFADHGPAGCTGGPLIAALEDQGLVRRNGCSPFGPLFVITEAGLAALSAETAGGAE